MAIRVQECFTITGGCMVTFVPDDEDAPLFVRRACRVHGWKMGETTASNRRGELSAVVRGVNATGFRLEFQGTPEFDFSCCRALAVEAAVADETRETRRLE